MDSEKKYEQTTNKQDVRNEDNLNLQNEDKIKKSKRKTVLEIIGLGAIMIVCAFGGIALQNKSGIHSSDKNDKAGQTTITEAKDKGKSEKHEDHDDITLKGEENKDSVPSEEKGENGVDKSDVQSSGTPLKAKTNVTTQIKSDKEQLKENAEYVNNLISADVQDILKETDYTKVKYVKSLDEVPSKNIQQLSNSAGIVGETLYIVQGEGTKIIKGDASDLSEKQQKEIDEMQDRNKKKYSESEYKELLQKAEPFYKKALKRANKDSSYKMVCTLYETLKKEYSTYNYNQFVDTLKAFGQESLLE
ncbi:hypothetical protein KTQ89_07030 [Holdemanella porci]|uniref:hypothetical protein n=1 Tax=Holdemanella porci TaxID=2652276 RepID=UPI001C2BC1EA|nr:hypothetical protein [Holdemanella porci]MBU9872106.1 hypothetical protein [Holdemanella porci]